MWDTMMTAGFSMSRTPERLRGQCMIYHGSALPSPGMAHAAVAPASADRWVPTAIFLTVPVVFGVWSVALGRDANWDLQNYHWYTPYALLTWRYALDVVP